MKLNGCSRYVIIDGLIYNHDLITMNCIDGKNNQKCFTTKYAQYNLINSLDKLIDATAEILLSVELFSLIITIINLKSSVKILSYFTVV